MQMLRAQEQIDGVRPSEPPFVRVPMLGLKRRMLVTQAGDVEYNGIYFCTQVNGNGYVFTKPRFNNNNHHPLVHRAGNDASGSDSDEADTDTDETDSAPSSDETADEDIASTSSPTIPPLHDGEHQHQNLRCVIAKRFSEQVGINYSLRLITV